MPDKFAVIDTETNWNDEVMSIGIVIAEAKRMKRIDSLYYSSIKPLCTTDSSGLLSEKGKGAEIGRLFRCNRKPVGASLDLGEPHREMLEEPYRDYYETPVDKFFHA